MSQRIPDSFIQEVIAHNDIVEIIRSRVQLIQRGDNHVARCPFHEEKTPSFNVSHSKQFYHCFGCGASGNIIGFLIAFDHLEFREAVAHLAARAGLTIPTTDHEEDTQRYQLLYEVLSTAAQYYAHTLRHNQQAIHYLKSRGVSGVTAKHFEIGYAPAGWEQLAQQMPEPERQTALTTSGLTIVKEQRAYDRFRDRIMFPIRNAQGKIIGFGGRTLGDGQPKYLNSPETPLFHKGAELYGLYEARQHTAKLTQLVIVEGYMDVVALHQYGITYTVATLGTAVTAKQIQKCLRYVNQLIFCFDGDSAGRQAAWKALTIALPLLREGIHIHFLFLPDGEDPDTLVRKIGAGGFLDQLTQAPPLTEVFFKEMQNQIPLKSPAAKAQFGQQTAQYLNTMPHGLFRQLMYAELAKILAIGPEALNDLLQPSSQPTAATSTPVSKGAAVRTHRANEAMPRALSEKIIGLLLEHPSLANEADPHQYEFIQSEPDKHPSRLLMRIWKLLRQQPTMTIGELLAQLEEEPERQLIAQLAARPKILSTEKLKDEFNGGLMTLTQQNNAQQMQILVEKAKKSELNLEEKRKLQTLLAKLKRDASER
jgi:DNA primase